MVRISDAEYEVMKIIWKRKETTSLEIIDDLKDYKWNFNTIRTLIKRLEAKGAIKVSGRKGKTYTYVAAIDENEYKREITRDLLKKLYNNSIEEFILDYSKGGKITTEDIKKLIDYIDERDAKKKKDDENKK